MHSEYAPMGEINTTPLIDVMLVLLVMVVLTIPIATHSVDVELPTECLDCDLLPLDAVKNSIVIDQGDAVLWNGTPVTQQQLAALLERSKHLPIEPELQFRPAANASYAASALTLRTIEASGVGRFGFVGNESYRSFGKSL